MTIEGFDYKNFAKSMAEQAKNLVPNDLDDYAKGYLVKTLENNTFLAGKSLYNDSSLKLNVEQAETITQFVSEWTFHKCVDLARSGIDSQYWDFIMQNIAFAVFEVAKQGMLRKLIFEQLKQVVEYHAVKSYNESIDELFNDGKITKEVVEIAKSQSNIDSLDEEILEKKNEKSSPVLDCDEFLSENFEEQPEKNPFKLLIDFIWNIIKKNRVAFCVLLLLLSFYGKVYLHHPPVELLRNIVLSIMLITSVPLLIFRSACNFYLAVILPAVAFATSIMMLLLHYNYAGWFCAGTLVLLIYGFKVLIDIDIQEQLKQLEEIKSKMQESVNPDTMYDSLGIDILSITVGHALNSIIDADQEDSLLPNIVALRKRLTETYGYIIPNVSMSKSDDLDEYEYQIKIRNNLVLSDIINLKKVTLSETVEKIIQELSKCVMEHVDLILTESDVDKYIAIVKNTNPSQVKYLQEKFSTYDIRKLFVNLIKDKVSIRDVGFIFMKLNEFSAETTNIEVLSKKLKEVLKK